MTSSHWSQTPFTDRTGVAFPIVQGPFGGGLSSVALTAAVSNLGGLGSFGCQPCTAGEIVDITRAIRAATDKPFNLNLWVGDRDERLDAFGARDYAEVRSALKPAFDAVGAVLPDMPTQLGPRFADQVEAILETRPPVFSFVYGIPPPDILERCRRNGTLCVGTATTVEEAVALENAGVDAVIATGFEAGGHRVSFLRSAEDSLTGLFALIPQVADSISIPVIAAGGIADARGLRAAFALGAHAVQIGSAFLATAQSNASAQHKEKLFSPEASDTTLTRIFTGRLSRGTRSRLTELLRDQEHRLAPYPMQSRVVAPLKAALSERQDTEWQSFWCGQAASLHRHRDAQDLFRALVAAMDENPSRSA